MQNRAGIVSPATCSCCHSSTFVGCTFGTADSVWPDMVCSVHAYVALQMQSSSCAPSPCVSRHMLLFGLHICAGLGGCLPVQPHAPCVDTDSPYQWALYADCRPELRCAAWRCAAWRCAAWRCAAWRCALFQWADHGLEVTQFSAEPANGVCVWRVVHFDA
jgi:hypothetical protein